MLRTVLLVSGILSAIPALLLVLAGLLGLAEILADVGPDENRTIGWQALGYAVPFVAASLMLIAASRFTTGKQDNGNAA